MVEIVFVSFDLNDCRTGVAVALGHQSLFHTGAAMLDLITGRRYPHPVRFFLPQKPLSLTLIRILSCGLFHFAIMPNNNERHRLVVGGMSPTLGFAIN